MTRRARGEVLHHKATAFSRRHRQSHYGNLLQAKVNRITKKAPLKVLFAEGEVDKLRRVLLSLILKLSYSRRRALVCHRPKYVLFVRLRPIYVSFFYASGLRDFPYCHVYLLHSICVPKTPPPCTNNTTPFI